MLDVGCWMLDKVIMFNNQVSAIKYLSSRIQQPENNFFQKHLSGIRAVFLQRF
jgi:hypothetical protein